MFWYKGAEVSEAELGSSTFRVDSGGSRFLSMAPSTKLYDVTFYKTVICDNFREQSMRRATFGLKTEDLTAG